MKHLFFFFFLLTTCSAFSQALCRSGLEGKLRFVETDLIGVTPSTNECNQKNPMAFRTFLGIHYGADSLEVIRALGSPTDHVVKGKHIMLYYDFKYNSYVQVRYTPSLKKVTSINVSANSIKSKATLNDRIQAIVKGGIIDPCGTHFLGFDQEKIEAELGNTPKITDKKLEENHHVRYVQYHSDDNTVMLSFYVIKEDNNKCNAFAVYWRY